MNERNGFSSDIMCWLHLPDQLYTHVNWSGDNNLFNIAANQFDCAMAHGDDDDGLNCDADPWAVCLAARTVESSEKLLVPITLLQNPHT